MGTSNASRKPKPTSTQKPNLQVIQGALSLYREGDVVTFELDGLEFEAAIESVEIKNGKALLWVYPAVGLYPHHVKRVERRPV